MKLSEAVNKYSMSCQVSVSGEAIVLIGNPTPLTFFVQNFNDETLTVEATNLPPPRTDFKAVILLSSPSKAFLPFHLAVE